MTIKQQGGIFGRNPTFNDVDIEGTLTVNGEPISDFGTMAQQDANAVAITGGSASLSGLTVDTNTLHVDATNNATLVGTTTWNTVYDPRLQVEGTSGDGTQGILVSSYKPSVTFFDYSGGTPAVHRIAADSGKLSFEIDTAQNGTFTEAFGVTAAGNIAMANGKGIDFSATSGSGTSELFDDYEEGTWNPVPFGSTAAGTYTTSFIRGDYVLVGKLCYISCTITATGFTGTGNFNISGLPFTVASQTASLGQVQYNTNPFATLTSTNQNLVAQIGANITFRASSSVAGGSYVTPQCSSSTISYLRVSGCYEVA